MAQNDNIQLFEDKRIRTAWDEEKEEWYFSIVDVVAVLTDSVDPAAYWRKLKQRLKAEGNETVTNCHGLQMTASDGKKSLTDVADTEQLLRIIQSIPSPKAEPFKLWLAQVGRERIEETIDPELTIERALETYLKKGYTREWINQRLQAIQVRKELTDEWNARGVQKGVEYAILTDEISRAWSGMSTRQYKNLKGLKKENLRDNMTTLELVLNMLAEATTTEISKQKAPETFSENIDVARAGGKVAGDTRKAIEGVCTHTCKHGARKIFLMGSDDTQVIRVEAGTLGAFDPKCVNSIVRVTGTLKEQRIDEAYLQNWEAQLKAQAAEKHGDGEAGCDSEKKARGETASTPEARIADFRAKIADRKANSGKEYLSFYFMEANSYEVE